MKHFLDIHKTDAADLRAMINSAHAMKTARNNRPKGTPDDDQPLAGRMVALIFEKPSTRTRVPGEGVTARALSAAGVPVWSEEDVEKAAGR